MPLTPIRQRGVIVNEIESRSLLMQLKVYAQQQNKAHETDGNQANISYIDDRVVGI